MLSHPSEKWWSESQLGWWHSQLNGKLKHVPKHQSDNYYQNDFAVWCLVVLSAILKKMVLVRRVLACARHFSCGFQQFFLSSHISCHCRRPDVTLMSFHTNTSALSVLSPSGPSVFICRYAALVYFFARFVRITGKSPRLDYWYMLNMG